MSLPTSSSTILLGGSVLVAFAVIQSVWRYQRKQQENGNTPGYKLIVSNTTQIMAVLPVFRIPFTKNWLFNMGLTWWGVHDHDVFQAYGQDIISTVSIDGAPMCYMLADAEAIQEVTGNRARFPKPTHVYKLLDIFGRNVATTEGEDWRIHRKITAPSFSENSNRLVHEETVSVMEGLFKLWKGKESVECSDFTDVSTQLALMVICGAGFGMRVPWSDQAPPAGHELSFKNAVQLVSSGLHLNLSIPSWAMQLTKRTARIALGFAELKKYMFEMIHDRESSYQNHNDLFSNLLAANAHDSEGLKLTNEELMGNIFIFLIAGHETTAHTLAFAAALLALYPDLQEKLYQHVKVTVADPSGAPTYNEIPNLNYAAAVFHETLRLFSVVVFLPKIAAEDTTLKTVNTKGETVIIPIQKGSFIHLIASALHTNPRYWPDPHQFKPERFLGDWPKNAYMPFSMGARSCIGRKFAEIEGTVALSMLIRNYRITITEDPKFVGETFEQRKARIFKVYSVFTLTPEKIPVTFTRREQLSVA